MKKLLLMLLVSLPSFGNIGGVVLTMTDRSGQARTNEGVTTGVAIPSSAAITDVRNLVVTNVPCGVGAAINSTRTAAERWGGTPTDTSKNIRWVWIDVVESSISANGNGQVCLNDRGALVDPGGSPLTITNAGGFITVATGSMTFKVSTTAFNFLDTVQVGATAVVSSSASSKWAVTANGVEYNTSNTDGTYAAVVEHPITNDANSAGELIRAQIKVSGKFTSGGAVQKMNYQMRLIAYANGTTIKCYPTLIFSEDMFAIANRPTSIVVSLPMAIGNSLAYTFGTQTGTQAGSYLNTDNVYLSQYWHGHGTLASNLTGYTIVKNGTSLGVDNHQAPGWADINDGSNGVTVWVRDFWQQYPAELKANGKTLEVHLWPGDGDTAVSTVGDGVTGPLDQVFTNERDTAFQFNPAGSTNALPFFVIWPYGTGQAMNFTPQAPNLVRKIKGLTLGNPTHITNNLGWNTDDNAEGYCTNQANPSCHYWISGTTQRVFIQKFTGCDAVLNGFQTATYTGTDFTIPVDTSGCSSITPPLNQSTSADPVASNMDSQTDMQAQGTAKTWEIQYNFYAGGLTTPGNTVAKMRDRLMLVNTAWLASSQAMGRIKEVDVADFPVGEANLNTAWNAFTASVDNNNYYGLFHYGDYLYDPGSPTPAGFGSRSYAISRKNWRLAPWMMYARTGDPQYLNWAIPITWHGIDVDLQHTTIGPYTDANNNAINKHVGSGVCTHGTTHWFPSYGFFAGAVGGGYICTEGEEPTLDYPSGAAEMAYVMLAYDRGMEVVVNEEAPFLSFIDGASNTINSDVAGRSLGGCWTLTLDTYKLSGTFLSTAEKCFAAAINHLDSTDGLGNPVGYAMGDRFGNGVDWSYFTDSWTTFSFAEMAEIDPNYCANDANAVSHCVRAEFNRFARTLNAMGSNNGTSGVYWYNFQGKTWAYGYNYTGDTTYLQYGQKMYNQYIQPIGTSIWGPSPDVHYWANYVLNMPFLEYGLLGKTPGLPSHPPYYLNLPADGHTVDFLVNKTQAGAWTYTFSIDTGDDFGGGFFNVAGTVTSQVLDPTNTVILTTTLGPCSYQGPTPCIPNSMYPVQSNNAVVGQGESITYGGVDNRVFTVTVPEDGKTGEYRIKNSAVNTGNPPGTCNFSGNDRYTCNTTTHFMFPMGTSLGPMSLVTPSILDLNCSLNPYQTPHVGRGIYYFNVPAGTTQIKVSMARTNYSLLSPVGKVYGLATTTTDSLAPGLWGLVSDPTLDDGSGTKGFCVSMKGVKGLLAAAPQDYYDSPSIGVSNTIQDYGGVITVNFSGMGITSTSPLPTGIQNTAYSFQLQSSGGTAPIIWSLINGTTLPSGMTLTSSGLVTGTPTVIGQFSGIQIQATDSSSPTHLTATATFSITVNPQVVGSCSIVTTSPLTPATLNVPYSVMLQGDSNCALPIGWTIVAGMLPAWANLNTSNGLISGTPNATGATTFTVQAVDTQNHTAQAQMSLTVSAGVLGSAITGKTQVGGKTAITSQ